MFLPQDFTFLTLIRSCYKGVAVATNVHMLHAHTATWPAKITLQGHDVEPIVQHDNFDEFMTINSRVDAVVLPTCCPRWAPHCGSCRTVQLHMCHRRA